MSNPERALKLAADVALSPPPAKRIPKPAARLAGPTDSAAPSPARQLQQKLEAAALDQPAGDNGVRWAPGATLLLSGGVSVLLWGAIALALGVHL
jgi:hypothetical protein